MLRLSLYKHYWHSGETGSPSPPRILCLCLCIYRVADHESVNLMSLTNLATIFAAVLVSSDAVSNFTCFHFTHLFRRHLFGSCTVLARAKWRLQPLYGVRIYWALNATKMQFRSGLCPEPHCGSYDSWWESTAQELLPASTLNFVVTLSNASD